THRITTTLESLKRAARRASYRAARKFGVRTDHGQAPHSAVLPGLDTVPNQHAYARPPGLRPCCDFSPSPASGASPPVCDLPLTTHKGQAAAPWIPSKNSRIPPRPIDLRGAPIVCTSVRHVETPRCEPPQSPWHQLVHTTRCASVFPMRRWQPTAQV